MLYMSAPVRADGVISADTNIGTIDTVNADFAEDRVIVVLNQETSLEFNTYNQTDFSEIGCAKVTDLTADMGNLVKQKIKQTKTAAMSLAYEETASKFMNELKVDSYKQVLCLELNEPGKENVYETIKTLLQRPDVYSATPDYCVYAESVTATSDPYYDDQWGLATCNFPAAWNLATSTNTVMVAVIDSGIDGDPSDCHPDLSNRIASYFNRDCIGSTTSGGLYDRTGHGTHIAGIIAATANNNVGICGAVGDNSVRLVSLKILDDEGKGYASDMARAIAYAATLEIPIVNISVGYTVSSGTDTSGGYFNYQDGLYTIMSTYPGLFVCSAGNNGKNTDSSSVNHYPSEYALDNIISVGAMSETKSKVSSSNYGSSSVDIFAPGNEIISCYSRYACELGCNTDGHITDGYHYNGGSSMATPFVTAVAAMIKAQYPSLTPAQIKARILNNAIQKNGLSCVAGGYLDAGAAMAG